MHLAVWGEDYCRAYLATGLAAAFAAQRVKVTLLEIGKSLPNIGYYFALAPSGYLGPVVDGRMALGGNIGRSIQYQSVGSFRKLKVPVDPFPPPRDPHLILNVFDAYSLSEDGSIPPGLAGQPDRFLRGKNVDPPAPRGLILFAGERAGTRGAKLVHSFLAFHPESPVFIALRGAAGGARPGEGGEFAAYQGERVTVPENLQQDLSRRMPPEGVFFTDLASRFLRVLGSMKKRKIFHGTG